MKKIVLVMIFILSPIVSSASNEAYQIVVNIESDLTQISSQELSMIFLGKKTLWTSRERIMPALITPEQEAGKAFIEKIIKQTPKSYNRYWRKRLFSGSGVFPRRFKEIGKLLAYVANNPGAIAVCAPTDMLGEKVKVISVME